MTVLNTGGVPAQSEAEYVENGERLPGGTADSQAKELAHGIKQRAVAKAYASQPIKQWMRRRDRCAAQFQGAKAFKRVQDFQRNCGVDLKDPPPPRHGREVALRWIRQPPRSHCRTEFPPPGGRIVEADRTGFQSIRGLEDVSADDGKLYPRGAPHRIFIAVAPF
jgi:hypothetical protein